MKDKLINIRVTSEERETWKEQAAKRKKRTLTEFIRAAVNLLTKKERQ